MRLAWTKAEVLALLSQLCFTGTSACLSEFHGHADLLKISFPLFNFVTGGAFTNHGNQLAFLSGGICGWTSLQVLGGGGATESSTLVDTGA